MDFDLCSLISVCGGERRVLVLDSRGWYVLQLLSEPPGQRSFSTGRQTWGTDFLRLLVHSQKEATKVRHLVLRWWTFKFLSRWRNWFSFLLGKLLSMLQGPLRAALIRDFQIEGEYSRVSGSVLCGMNGKLSQGSREMREGDGKRAWVRQWKSLH